MTMRGKATAEQMMMMKTSLLGKLQHAPQKILACACPVLCVYAEAAWIGKGSDDGEDDED
jgi:hypothetical protein